MITTVVMNNILFLGYFKNKGNINCYPLSLVFTRYNVLLQALYLSLYPIIYL